MQFRIRGKTFLAALVIFAVALAVFVGAFYGRGRPYAVVSLGQEYYFLVRDASEETVETSARDSYLSGGAGYLYGTGKSAVVVLACYYSETDAVFVGHTLSEKGIEASLLKVTAEDFEAEGEAARERASIEANAATVDSCARVLFTAANSLERSLWGQEAARTAVKGAADSLKGLRAGNEADCFSLWNVVLGRCERRLRELCEGILFARDLRYQQVALCLAVTEMSACFS